ncbi:arsenic efflux protein [bacterium]|nr:arsenic efflux protein [bacterium]
MNEIFAMFNEVISFPEVLINKCTFLPDYISMALLKSIYFVPVLVFLYLLVEILEKFVISNIPLFIKLLRKYGAFFSAATGIVPECGYANVISVLYSRNIISRGTLLAALIMCSDDALPLLFIDFSKVGVILPILVLKFIAAIAVAYIADFLEVILNLRIKKKDDLNSMNMDINIHGCCYHAINTNDKHPRIINHTLVHTLNVLIFTFLVLSGLYFGIGAFGSTESFASVLMIDSPVSVLVVAALGLISNCFISILIAIAFVLGLISFPAFLAGMITVTGLGLFNMFKFAGKKEGILISFVLFVLGTGFGLAFYYGLLTVNSTFNLVK